MASDEHPPEEAQPETGDAQGEERDTGDDTLPRLLTAISEQVGGIRDQLERLLNVQADRFRLLLRKGLFWLLSSLLFGAVCVVATAAAVLYLLEGVAGMFATLFGGNAWAGDLAAGGLVLLTVLLAVSTFARRQRKTELERLKQKYEPDSTKGETQ